MISRLSVGGNIETTEEESPAAWTREEQELAILGCLLYDDKCDVNLLAEDDFTGKKRSIFRIIKNLKHQNSDMHLDDVIESGEEMGIFVTSEDYQLMTLMTTLGDQLQFFQAYISAIRSVGTARNNTNTNTCQGGRHINIYPKGGISPKPENLASQGYSPVTSALQPVTACDSLSDKIQRWIEDTTAWFTYSQLDSELGIKTDSDKNNRRLILKRLCGKGIVQRHPEKEGKYRHVKTSIERLDLRSITHRSLDIQLPLGIDKYVRLYPGNIIVVAGSPNAGKTAFLLNVIKLNLNRWANKIWYFCSEMGAEELRSRLDLFPFSDDDLEKFEAARQVSNFADIIEPDSINIVDYLEMSTDLWVIADYLTAIQKKLANGLAVVAIQKKRGSDLGRGAEFGEEKPRLYITMENGTLTIKKAKTWKDKTINPNEMVAKFKLVNGCDFSEVEPLGHQLSGQSKLI